MTSANVIHQLMSSEYLEQATLQRMGFMKRARIILLSGVLLLVLAATLSIVRLHSEARRQLEAQEDWRSSIDDIVSLSLVARWDEEELEDGELKLALEALRGGEFFARREYHGTGRWALRVVSSDGTITRWMILDDGDITAVYVDGDEIQTRHLSGILESVRNRMNHDH